MQQALTLVTLLLFILILWESWRVGSKIVLALAAAGTAIWLAVAIQALV